MNYNEYDEMFEQEMELDDIQERKALIEEAKTLDPEAEWKDVAPQINSLKKAWKRLPSNESAAEEELRDEFEAILDVHFKKQRENMKNAKAAKEEDAAIDARNEAKKQEYEDYLENFNNKRK